MIKKPYFYVLFALFIGSCSDQDSSINEAASKSEDAVNVLKEIPKKITFPSMDELPVTANLYHLDDDAPVLVLCHQAGFNKVEYIESANTFHQMGFNCLATDQRSGGHIVEWWNETYLAATDSGLPTDYLDAEQDIIAAVNFAANKYGKPVILLGSSYSSTLALWIASENDNVKAVIAFSPGNYFMEQKGDLSLRLTNLKKPMLVTSSKKEAPDLAALISKMELNEQQSQFIPQSEGVHGARALWKTNKSNEEYWAVVKDFLGKLK